MRAKKSSVPLALRARGLVKRFGDTTAVAGIDLSVPAGSFFGVVGPNGAGKTTTLSMISGLLQPDAGTVFLDDLNVWTDPVRAKARMGILPDALATFDRLTGAEALYYAGILHGLTRSEILERSGRLASAFGFESSLGRLVSDYSAGMAKKLALASAIIHGPRVLILDEPFEAVDPVSAVAITDILRDYTERGGTIILSSHSIELVERICDSVAVIVSGAVLASGSVDEVRGDQPLEQRFAALAGERPAPEGLAWLHSFSD